MNCSLPIERASKNSSSSPLCLNQIGPMLYFLLILLPLEFHRWFFLHVCRSTYFVAESWGCKL